MVKGMTTRVSLLNYDILQEICQNRLPDFSQYPSQHMTNYIKLKVRCVQYLHTITILKAG